MSAQNFAALLLNLDRDTQRLAHMQNQLAQAHIAFTRLPGILGDAVPDTLRLSFFDVSGVARTGMKRGEIGCYASHLAAMQKIAGGAYGDAVLVMEDDLTIEPDLCEIIAAARKYLPRDWDILRLSCPPRRAYVVLARLDATHALVRYSKIPNSAGAYLITPAGARKFLQHGVRGLTFDDDLRRPWFHHMETFGIVAPPVKAGALRSSIDAIEAGRFDKGLTSRLERIRRGDHFHALKRVAYNMRSLGYGTWMACAAINLADMIVKPFLGHSIIDHAARFLVKEGPYG